ncbi:chorionic somatomammotropin hormone 1-like [Oryx dammah]|uniref:chorionic somatomammotropin hormone 1-like n=1 Tax=Oryx dammah TaxID=59534 RepID=UPI001A9AF60D|nr:chorionic somatomammotropin hormone 1-like [Oryx dammah]
MAISKKVLAAQVTWCLASTLSQVRCVFSSPPRSQLLGVLSVQLELCPGCAAGAPSQRLRRPDFIPLALLASDFYLSLAGGEQRRLNRGRYESKYTNKHQENKAQKGSCLLLLLVVSNLLLCQGVVSAPLCQNPFGKCQMPLQNLFDTATMTANYNYRLAWEMFSEFLNKQFGQGKNFISKVLNRCHTKSIITPDNKEAEYTQDEILIRLVLSLLLSWDEPLHHLVTELQGMKDTSPDPLSKAAEIEEKTKVLLEGAEQIQKKIHPEDQEKETSYPVWLEISSLTAGDEDVCQTAFYKMFHCLHRDTIKIDIISRC